MTAYLRESPPFFLSVFQVVSSNDLLSISVIAAAGHIVFGEQGAHGHLIFIGLHEVPPRPVAPQALDAGEVGHSVVLQRKRPVEEVAVLVVEGADFVPLHGGAEKAGGFAGERQSLLLDGGDAVLPVPVPIDEGVFLFVLLVHDVVDDGMVAAALLARVEADVLGDPLSPRPCLLTGRVVVAELVLRRDFVLEGTPLIAVGDGGQRAGAQAFLLQREAVAILIHIFHNGDGRHSVGFQPRIHNGDVLVGVPLLTARVGKEDEVDRDAVPVHPDEHGG